MIDALLFIGALIAITLFMLDVISSRKARKARSKYIDEIERSICKPNN